MNVGVVCAQLYCVCMYMCVLVCVCVLLVSLLMCVYWNGGLRAPLFPPVYLIDTPADSCSDNVFLTHTTTENRALLKDRGSQLCSNIAIQAGQQKVCVYT